MKYRKITLFYFYLRALSVIANLYEAPLMFPFIWGDATEWALIDYPLGMNIEDVADGPQCGFSRVVKRTLGLFLPLDVNHRIPLPSRIEAVTISPLRSGSRR